MVGLATIGIFGKTQYPDKFTPRWVNACMISSGLCCVLGLATACLVTNKNVDSQTPDAAPPSGAAAPSAPVTSQSANTGAQLSQMYNTQVSPVLTVSVLDMDVTTGRSTFLPLIGYPVNHDFNLQLLLPNRYGNAEQILGVHLPQNGEPGQVHRAIVQARHTDGKTPNEKTVLADHLKRIASEAKQAQDGKMELGGFKDNSANNGVPNAKKMAETPPPSYSSLEISVQCGLGGNAPAGGANGNTATDGPGPVIGVGGTVNATPGLQPETTAASLEYRDGVPAQPGERTMRERQPLPLLQQQLHFQQTVPASDRTERTERPPSYDTALCRLVENAAGSGVEEQGAVGGIAMTVEAPSQKVSAGNNKTKETSTRKLAVADVDK